MRQDYTIAFKSDRFNIRTFKESDINDFMEYRNNMDWMKYQGFKGLSKEEYEDVLLKDVSLEKGMQLAIINKSDESCEIFKNLVLSYIKIKMDLDLNEHMKKVFFKLSGGMKQKLLIAIAIAKTITAMSENEITF